MVSDIQRVGQVGTNLEEVVAVAHGNDLPSSLASPMITSMSRSWPEGAQDGR